MMQLFVVLIGCAIIILTGAAFGGYLNPSTETPKIHAIELNPHMPAK
jgi:hypothetical protein